MGITAQVLSDIGRTKSKEAKIILDAAMIDDVMELVILAVVVGIISAAATETDGITPGQMGWIIAKATLLIILNDI